MQSIVYNTGPTRFDMSGQALPPFLRSTDKTISAGLVKRLHRYALNRLEDSGFASVVAGWAVQVYTIDGDLPPSERTYCVRFVNPKQGHIELTGILTRNGWPTLDFGLDIGEHD